MIIVTRKTTIRFCNHGIEIPEGLRCTKIEGSELPPVFLLVEFPDDVLAPGSALRRVAERDGVKLGPEHVRCGSPLRPATPWGDPVVAWGSWGPNTGRGPLRETRTAAEGDVRQDRRNAINSDRRLVAVDADGDCWILEGDEIVGLAGGDDESVSYDERVLWTLD